MSPALTIRTPRLEVDLPKIQHNARTLATLCEEQGVALVGVTKGCGGMPEVARAMLAGGAVALGDSQLLNLNRLRDEGIDAPLQLLRTPLLSQTLSTVRLADLSLNTDMTVLRQLARDARRTDVSHSIILMLEIGDNREGLFPDEIADFAAQVEQLDGVELAGIGASVGCRHLVYAQPEQVALLVDARQQLEDQLGRQLAITSLGGTVALPLLLRGECPPGITQMRIGEAILLGEDAVEQRPVPGTYQDAVTLVAEVIEVRRPKGRLQLRDGYSMQALVAVGYQDVSSTSLTPLTLGVHIDGESGDHLILVGGETITALKTGQEVRFLPTYPGLVQLCTSPYVAREFVGLPPEEGTGDGSGTIS